MPRIIMVPNLRTITSMWVINLAIKWIHFMTGAAFCYAAASWLQPIDQHLLAEPARPNSVTVLLRRAPMPINPTAGCPPVRRHNLVILWELLWRWIVRRSSGLWRVRNFNQPRFTLRRIDVLQAQRCSSTMDLMMLVTHALHVAALTRETASIAVTEMLTNSVSRLRNGWKRGKKRLRSD